MALKNDESIDGFGQKLLQLMKESGCDTSKALAIELYDRKLITVRTKLDSDIFKKRNNAIGSIEKKIRVHIHSKEATCLQGEFVRAYCEFFKCSSDYLFGYTEIKSPQISIREMCDLTGLSEEAVIRLVKANNDSELQYLTVAWSRILTSELFQGIPQDWKNASLQAKLVIQKSAEAKAAEWEMENVNGPDLMDLRIDHEGYIEEEKSARAAYAGLLFNISRNVAGFVEGEINAKMSQVKQVYDDGFLKEAKDRHPN